MNGARLRREQAHAEEIINRLEKSFPGAETELKHENPWELLAATILSAQCTDVRVNQVTPGLFSRYPTPLDISKADREMLESIIRPTGFYKNKAKSLMGCAKGIVERFEGRVPETMEALVTLAGVGRKTANVVLGSAFGKPAIVVDTHVRRVANRLKMTRSDDPDRIEIDLGRLLPKGKWTSGSHRMLLHGRYLCVARNPRCLECPLFDLCPAEAEKAQAQQAQAQQAEAEKKGAARRASRQ